MSYVGAGNFDVPPIFGSGDKAFTKEALGWCPNMETVSVKECFQRGSGDEITYGQYYKKNIAAIHLTPAEACERIYKGAFNAITRFMMEPEKFNCLKIQPPYIQFQRIRSTGAKEGMI